MRIDHTKLEKQNIQEIQKRGIYYLYNKWELVYIWQSENIYTRIYNHINDKEFDSFSYLEIDKNISLDNIEMSEIIKYKPKYNKFIYEENSKNRLKAMFNLIRRMWYSLPNINRFIYEMNREQLIGYLKEKTNINENDIRYIVNLKTTEINILRNKVWPIM